MTDQKQTGYVLLMTDHDQNGRVLYRMFALKYDAAHHVVAAVIKSL